MEMQQIRYFLALSRTLNFTRAAEECNVSQPALTRAVQALEAELGGELIRRERAQSHLTELGRRMLPLMQQCYEAAVSAKSLARAVQTNEVALLPIAIANSVSLSSFVPPVAELFRTYPGLQLKIRRGSAASVLDMLKSGDIELAIAGPLGTAWERLDMWPLFEEQMVVAVHRDHRLSRVNDIGVRHLAGEHLVLRSGCEMETAVTALLEQHGVVPGTTHEIDTDDEFMALLQANVGVAVVPETLIRGTALHRLRLPEWSLRRTVHAYAVAGRRRAPVATTLLNLLRAAELPAEREVA
ncbi:MAG TPA: LysR family transcriptional regulator [Acetobacteraceae bacterium]|jgi:DNA-binding transcriptional LysR family regulator|nr:LysR family transcriptional regulator [Acetobacteraceae bacterium]